MTTSMGGAPPEWPPWWRMMLNLPAAIASTSRCALDDWRLWREAGEPEYVLVNSPPYWVRRPTHRDPWRAVNIAAACAVGLLGAAIVWLLVVLVA